MPNSFTPKDEKIPKLIHRYNSFGQQSQGRILGRTEVNNRDTETQSRIGVGGSLKVLDWYWIGSGPVAKTAALHFAHFGYVGTSLRSLANEFGVSLAAIQYHIATKEELLYAVIDGEVVLQPRLSRDTARAIGDSFDP